MKILKKSQMPDGTNIQIEDWKNDYSYIKTLTIGTYPKAKNTSISGYIEKNKNFRLELSSFESDEQVENVFKELEKGKISLENLSEYFREGQKDKFYLGLADSEEIVQNKDIDKQKDMKTLPDWENSKATTFEDFFIPGDIVGEDVVKHFRNVQIPITDNAYLMQMGEPQNCIDGKITYMTFSKEPEGWIYRGDCHKGETKSPFEKWLDTFIKEKEIDLHEEFKSTNGSISMFFCYSDIINAIKTTSKDEQSEIKNILVAIDYKNGDIKDYLRHLSKALIPTKEQVKEMESIYGESIGIEKEDVEDFEDLEP